MFVTWGRKQAYSLDKCDHICYILFMSDFDNLIAEIKEKFKQLDVLAGGDQQRQRLVIAEKIKFYRKANHLTQEDLAKKLYVTKMAIIRWEKGGVMPSESSLARFKDLGIIE